jgi:hypothetical protein
MGARLRRCQYLDYLFGGALIKVRASDGVILGKYYIFEPLFVACDGSSVWVTNTLGDVTKFRGSDGAVEKTIDLGSSQLRGIIFDGTSIWVAAPVGNAVYKLRPSDGALLGFYTVGLQPYQLAFDGANVWVTNEYSDSVSKLRASDGHLLSPCQPATLPTASSLMAMTFGWLTHIPAGMKQPKRLRSLDSATVPSSVPLRSERIHSCSLLMVVTSG